MSVCCTQCSNPKKSPSGCAALTPEHLRIERRRTTSATASRVWCLMPSAAKGGEPSRVCAARPRHNVGLRKRRTSGASHGSAACARSAPPFASQKTHAKLLDENMLIINASICAAQRVGILFRLTNNESDISNFHTRLIV